MKITAQILNIIVVTLLFFMVESCSKSDYYDTPKVEEDLETTNDSTYCMLSLNLSYNEFQMTRATDDGTAEERKVTNLMLMFFDANTLKLEVSAMFTDMQPVGSNGDQYRLNKAMQVAAGRKKVVALANVSPALLARLATIKTYGDMKAFQVNTKSGTAPSGNSNYLNEAGVLDQNGNINVGNDGYKMNILNGLLMTGECEENLIGGVTESQVQAGIKNNISLYIERVVSKIFVNVSKNIFRDIPNYFSPIQMTGGGVFSPTINVMNLPKTSYLSKRDNNISPFYNSLDFTNWNVETVGLHSGLGIASVDRTLTLYVPENTFETAYRANVTYLSLMFRVQYGSSMNAIYAFYDETQDKTYFYEGIWVGSPNKWEATYVRRFFDSKKNDYMEGNSLQAICVMPKNLRSKADQDAELRKQIGTSTIPGGYYLFVYRAEMIDPTLKTEVWYDEMQLYKYTGNSTDRENRKDFKSAYYHGQCYYRVNIEDILEAENSRKRYAINRNDFFRITIKGVTKPKGTGFELPGYPRQADLGRRPSDKLTESGLDVDFKVIDWNNGGSGDVDIEH